MTDAPKIDAKLLEVLRCPVGVKMGGDNPGALSIAHGGWWLVCAQSGYKYPVIDGIPHTIPEVGEQWKDTPTESLPVPPPA